MNNQDTASRANQNEGPPTDTQSGRKRPHYGQSLPRTAPVPNSTKQENSPQERALHNVPDWRPEAEIIREAAAKNPRIKIPAHLQPQRPRRLEARIRPPIPHAAPDTRQDQNSSFPLAPGISPPDIDPPPALRGKDASRESGKTHLTLRDDTISAAEKHQSYRGMTTANDVLQLSLNLIVLVFPTLCVLLVSGWGPQEIAILFEELWHYFVLSVLVTLVVVLSDLVAQRMVNHLQLPKAASWIAEFLVAAICAAACLVFFTHNLLGALLLGLVISVLTSLLSTVTAKLF